MVSLLRMVIGVLRMVAPWVFKFILALLQAAMMMLMHIGKNLPDTVQNVVDMWHLMLVEHGVTDFKWIDPLGKVLAYGVFGIGWIVISYLTTGLIGFLLRLVF